MSKRLGQFIACIFLTLSVAMLYSFLSEPSPKEPYMNLVLCVFDGVIAYIGVLIFIWAAMLPPRRQLMLALCGLVVCGAATLEVWHVLCVRSRPRDWYDGISRSMDESFKSSGFVKVGAHTWALPKDIGTNQVPGKTNATIKQ